MDNKLLNDTNILLTQHIDFFDKKLSMEFPGDFKINDEIVKEIFPLGINPQVSYRIMDNLMLSLEYTEHIFPTGVIGDFCEVIEALLRKNRSINFQKRYISQNKNHEIGVVEFVQHDFYETLLFTIIDSKVLIGYFSFRSNTYKSNYETMKKIIESIK